MNNKLRYSGPADWLAAAERELSPIRAWQYADWIHSVFGGPYTPSRPAPGDHDIARKLVWC